MSTTELMPFVAGLLANPEAPDFEDRVRAGAVELARRFHHHTNELRRLWAEFGQQTEALDKTFGDMKRHGWGFKVDLYYRGSPRHDWQDKPAIDEVIHLMNVSVWEHLIDRMGIKNLMSAKRRAEFERQLEKGDVPDVTENAILSTIFGLADQAAEFAIEAAKETLELLTPYRSDYKTNSGFKVGRKAILTLTVEPAYGGGFRPCYSRGEADLISIDGTFHVLDGKGPLKGYESPLVMAIKASPDGRGSTDYFAFRCYQNKNIHLTFKRLDLVKQLNGLATGEFVLGQYDPE